MSGYPANPEVKAISKQRERKFGIDLEFSSYEGNVGGNTSLPLK
jgi:hypothetical protein